MSSQVLAIMPLIYKIMVTVMLLNSNSIMRWLHQKLLLSGILTKNALVKFNVPKGVTLCLIDGPYGIIRVTPQDTYFVCRSG